MKRPHVLPLPGNSTRGPSTFYEEQTQSIAPGVIALGVEWPGSFELDTAVPQDERPSPPDRPDPSPFKLGGM